MYIDKIKLINFRNYSAQSVIFDKGVNVICGSNAQGKTNLVEAVYFACVGRSGRTPRDKELIKWGSDHAYIKLNAVKKFSKTSIEVFLTQTENKRISVNGVSLMRIGEIMGAVSVVFFSPDELKIVKESPGDRRRYLDILLCQLSKSYFYNLGRYNRIISQRNKLLKSGNATTETLFVWDTQLAETGAKIAFARKNLTDKLTKHAYDAHFFLTDGSESLVTAYEGIEGATEEEIKENFMTLLSKNRTRDISNGFTNSGVHKDDLSLKINGIDVRVYGSQGQQRTAALALKIAEKDIFLSETNEPPILILDDVLSELDERRQVKLVEKIGDCQAFITCTHIEPFIKTNSILKVSGGAVVEE